MLGRCSTRWPPFARLHPKSRPARGSRDTAGHEASASSDIPPPRLPQPLTDVIGKAPPRRVVRLATLKAYVFVRRRQREALTLGRSEHPRAIELHLQALNLPPIGRGRLPLLGE